MLTRIVILSLIITAIHVCTWDGMIFSFVRFFLDRAFEIPPFERVAFLRKPLYECLICMGGVYTLVLDPLLFGWSWWVIADMLAVIGLNTLISAAICRLKE